MKKRIVWITSGIVGVAVAIAAVFGAEIVLAIYSRKPETFTNPSHQPLYFGDKGSALTYVVIGDSTGAGQGAPYDSGIAVGTAKHLAERYRVKLVNFSISGATSTDVVKKELVDAARLHPNVVLLSVGANDSTHFASARELRSNLEKIVDVLREASPAVKIVVTGCPQMGSVPRFLQPLRWFAGAQTKRINDVFSTVVTERRLTWSRIADRTGPIFEQDPSLFAKDEFHPNARGYAIWLLVLNQTLDEITSPSTSA